MTKPKLSRAWALRSLPSLLVSAPGVCGSGCGARFGRAANNVTNINFRTGATVESDSSRPPGIGLPIHQDCLAGDAEWPGIHLETAPLRAQASMAAVWLVGWKVPAQPLAFQFSLISSADSKRLSFSLPYCASVSVRKVCRRKGKLYPTDTEKFQCFPSHAAAMIITNACALRPRIKRMCFSSLHAFWLLSTSSADYALGHRLHPHLRHHLPSSWRRAGCHILTLGNIA